MSIQKYSFTIILIMSFVYFSFPRMLLSEESPRRLLSREERVAVVSKFAGHVEIQHEAVWKSLTKTGKSTKGYSVYDDDTIFTRSSSTADLFFNDHSQVKIKEDTILSVSTRQITKGERTQDRVIMNAADMQGDIVRNINLQAGKLWANIIPTKSLLIEFETPAGVVSVSSSVLSLINTGIKTTLEVLDGLVTFRSKGDEILFKMKAGKKVNIFYPGGGRASVEVKAGMVDVRTKFGNVKVETGESIGVSEDAVTGEVTIIAEIGILEHKTNAGIVRIRESGSVTVKEDSVSGEIVVTDTDDGITITRIDGTTTRVAVGSSIGTLTEKNAPTEYATHTPGEQMGMGNISPVSDDGSETSLDIDTEDPDNDTVLLSKHGTGTPPSTDYLLDFARKIRN